MSNPRILYIATFPPPVHGSAVVSMQIKNSKVINEAFDGDYVNLSTSKTMDEIGRGGIVPNLKKLWRFSKAFLRTFWLLLTRHYDLCYCAITIGSACFLRDAPFVLLCKMFGHKVVIHQHNKGMSRLIDKPIYRWLYPLTYRNVKVILLSWYLYPDIERVVKKEDVMICPNGIRPTAIEVSKGFNGFQKVSGGRVPHIFFLSNLIIEKGVLVLLDALEILKDKGYSFVCDFVGGETKDIDATRFAQEVEKRGLNKIAIYHGKKYGADKEEFWKNADVFAFPTLNEAFGLVALEAMEHSIPVVASNEGGVPEVVHDNENGFLVEKRNCKALADALCKLLDDESLRKKMGERGYQMFVQKFTEEKFENTLLQALKSVNSGGGGFTFVNYWGRKYGSDKEVFWDDADIFVFPTYYYNECFPLVLLEAMEKGVPCISTEEGGIRDIIVNGENGYNVPQQNPQALASAIEKLLNDEPLRYKMGEKGRQLFQEKFTELQFENTMLQCLKRGIE